MRKKYPPAFKAKVVLAAIKGDKTLSQLSSEFGVQSIQISKWKRQAIEQMEEAFVGKRKKHDTEKDKLIEELFTKIGQLQHEVDWLKKKLGLIS